MGASITCLRRSGNQDEQRPGEETRATPRYASDSKPGNGAAPLNDPLIKGGQRDTKRLQHRKPAVPAANIWESSEGAWTVLNKIQDEGKEVKFFEHLEIAEDGGLSEIGVKADLWYGSRYFSSLLMIVFVIYNIYFLMWTDLASIYEDTSEKPHKEFLITSSIVSQFGGEFSNPQKCVSFLELLILCGIIANASWHICRAVCASGYSKWKAVAHLCWFDLPELSVFSAIKMLQYVTPQQLSYDLNYLLWYEPEKTKTFKLVRFAVLTPCILLLGLDCFLIKVRLANKFIMAEEASWSNVLGSIILLNQILGVVQIAKTIKNRLYRFVFAGEDGMMTAEEQTRQNVWEAMVANKIFRSYPYAKAAALMLSWCDDDFQMMTLNEMQDSEV